MRDGCNCHTSYAYDGENADMNKCFLDMGFNKWGWTIGPLNSSYFDSGSVTWEIYSQAHDCDINMGDVVGNAVLEYNVSSGEGELTVATYSGYFFTQIDLWVDNEKLPRNNKGHYSIATKRYTESYDGETTYHQFDGAIDTPFWMSIHAEVKMNINNTSILPLFFFCFFFLFSVCLFVCCILSFRIGF